jgi:geranylgeranyl diphosphate synthase type II
MATLVATPKMSVLTFPLSRHRALVDEALDRFLVGPGVRHAVLHRAMRYSVLAGGKRLRPMLCLAAADLFGTAARRVLPSACALELIHTYSLIHDDLPAMDDDDLRRGRPTSHKKFGEGVAILAGDALLTQAFELMARNARELKVAGDRVLKAIEVVARAAGSLGMVGGQAADLEAEGTTFKNRSLVARREALDYIHRHKTGALIRGSLAVGAILAGAGRRDLAALDRYGENIGLAFQIADDVLDIVGDKQLLGKRGSDRDNGKLTFPALYGLDESRRRAAEAVRRARAALAPFGKRALFLRELADYIIQRER